MLGCRASSSTSVVLCSGRRWLSSSGSSPDHYAVLGVPASASAKELKQAYYELSKQHHPDVSGVADSADNFHRLQAAYEVLGNEEQRRAYDAQRNAADSRAGFRAAAAAARRAPPGAYASPGNYDRFYPGADYFHDDPDSFTSRHRPDSFDRDYRNFVEFQRRWRTNQRVSRTMGPPPPSYWADRSEREYESFHRGSAPHGFEQFVREEFGDKDFEGEQRRMEEIQRQRAEEQERQRRLRKETADLYDFQRRRQAERDGKALRDQLHAAAVLGLLAAILLAAFSPTTR